MYEWAAKFDEYARGMISGSGSTLFEELGLYYIGPVDGHSIDDLVAILKEVKSTKTTGPVLIHVVTEKGRGYPYAEKAADKYHGKFLIVIIANSFNMWLSEIVKISFCMFVAVILNINIRGTIYIWIVQLENSFSISDIVQG